MTVFTANMRPRGIVILVTMALCAFCTLLRAQSPAADETAVVKAAIKARIQSLQNISAEYDIVAVATPKNPMPDQPLPGGGFVRNVVDPMRTSDYFSFLNGKARWRWAMSKQNVDAAIKEGHIRAARREAAYVDGRVEFMDEFTDGRQGGGFNHTFWSSFFEVGLGIRAGAGDHSVIRWLAPDDIDQMELLYDAERRPVLTERQPDGKIYEYTYDSKRGYALVRYRVINPPGVPGYDPTEILAEDFRVGANGIPLPHTVIMRAVRTDGWEMGRWTASVRSYKLDDPSNTEDRYQLRWPAGVRVLDRRTMTHVRTREEGVLDEARLGELIEAQERELAEALGGPTTRQAVPTTQP